jgi:hypothetical protein
MVNSLKIYYYQQSYDIFFTNMPVFVQELTEHHPITEQPKGGKLPLKRHQLTLLHRCKQFENEKLEYAPDGITVESGSFVRTYIGIIGDMVGSGKSYTILALMMDNPTVNSEPILKTYGNNNIVISRNVTNNDIKTNLLVIPHNLCNQWVNYITDYTQNFSWTIVKHNKSLQALYEADIPSLDLIVVTCTFYNRLAYLLNDRDYRLRRIVFDEIDSMNLPSCEEINSCFQWFVTASFQNLLHPHGHSMFDRTLRRYIMSATGLKNTGFVKNLFSDLNTSTTRSIAKMLVVRNTEEYVNHSLQLPNMFQRYIKCRSPAEISILQGIVDKNIIDCLNANDIETAISYINVHNRRTEDNIVLLLIDKYQKQKKNIEMRMETVNQLFFETNEERQLELQRLEKKHEEYNTKIKSIEQRILDGNTCPICYDEVEKKTIVPCCSNAFCFKCLNLWLINRNKVCPLCKTHIKTDDLLVVQDVDASTTDIARVCPPCNANDFTNELHETNDKLQNLHNLLLSQQSAGRKFLIFCSYENTLSSITQILHQCNITYGMLKGNNYQIKHMVDRYKTGNVDALLVNPNSYGSGLNLENTTDVIMFHKFDSEIEKQVIGRAQRFGRSGNLNVWYLLYDNEMRAA